MAIAGAEETLKKISSQIESQFPGFIREEGPQFVAFLKAYFEYMDQSGNAVNATRTIRDNKDIDRTVDSFVEYFRREFMVNIPSSVLADKRLLAKHIREFYRTRGSQESFRFLFRALFNQEIDLYYPGDDILRASDGRWKRETRLRIAAPFSKNPRSFEGQIIQGVTSGATAYVQDIIGTTALGLEVYDITIENVVGSFVDGERVFNTNDTSNYATINSQVGSLTDVTITNGGAFHNLSDTITISGSGSTEDATAVITEVTNKSGVTVTLTKTGSGYTKENTTLIVTGGNGKDFEIAIDSWKKETIGGLSINTDLIGPMKNVRLNTPSFFVRQGTNTSPIATKLTGTVSTSTVSNTITGSGTNFTSQLAVGDIVRIAGVANTARVHSITNATSFVSVHTPFQNVSGANGYIGLAAANVSTRLVTALKFSTQELYAINAIALINPGYGYDTTLPTIRIVDSVISVLNISDGYGNIYGNNAVVTASNAPGSIKKLRIITPGSNFARYGEAQLYNSSQANSIIEEAQVSSNTSGSAQTKYLIRQKTFSGVGSPNPSGIIQFPGRYIDTKGFLSWNNRLQDNYYYQEFSYVVRVSELLSKYKEIVKSLLHPAGTKMFADYVITSNAAQITTINDEAPIFARRAIRETITSTAAQNAFAEYTNGINLTETVTVTVDQLGSFVANTARAESITVTVVDNATYVANTFDTAVTTAISTEASQLIANAFIVSSIASSEATTAGIEFSALAVETFEEIIGDYANNQVTPVGNSQILIYAGLQDDQVNYTTFATNAAESVSTTAIHQGQRFAQMLNVYAKVPYANAESGSADLVQIQTYDPLASEIFDGSARLVIGTQGPYAFANGALTANAGSINVGGIGTNLYIIPVSGSNTTIFNVNTIYSNTYFTIRQNYIPTQANVQIYYSTGP